ncbi:MAG: PVC-type heme-binding CxxCH protein [Planctomycetota bacterium]
MFALPHPQDAAAPRFEDVSTSFQIAPELEVSLWAESPELYNPTAIDVDAKGRVWVTEAVNYRQWRGRNPGKHNDAGDRVVILEDTDGDGRCDSSKVFAQEKDLVAPLGIAVIGDKVYVSCSPNLFVYTDSNGDDVPDKREVFLTGFGGHDHDHGLHSVVAGPDGKLYFNTGNAGPHVVKDRLGWTLRSGSLYNDGGEFLADNKPGLVSDDGRVWTGGLILRIGANAEGLSVLAHNFRNNYEVAVDSFGTLWQDDNDDDGNQSCRTLYCMTGGNHGYFSSDGARFWNADRRPGQEVQRAHWHQDDPGVVPNGCINGAGGPTGVAVYEGELLPAKYQGAILDCDAGANVVYAHLPRAKGAGYELEKTVLLTSRTGRGDDRSSTWFRPSDVCVATDGALYVSDWWDPGVGGHAAGDKLAYGRILRIQPKGAKPLKPVYDVSKLQGAIAALCSPAVNVRVLGYRALVMERGLAVRPLRELYASKNPRYRARALWTLAQIPDEGQKAIDLALRDADPDLRIAAWRAQCQKPPFLPQYALQLSKENATPAVLREVALSLREQNISYASNPWMEVAKAWDGRDPWLLEALGIGAQGKESQLYDLYFQGDTRPVLEWSPAQAGIAWRLHPKQAIPALTARGRATSLTPAERRRAVDALAFCKERDAAEAMLQIALAGPDDVRELATWWVRHKDESDWSEYRLAKDLAPVGRAGNASAKLVWSSGVLEQGSKACDVDVTGARSLWLVVTSGARGNGHDWSDWLDARLVGAQGETRLDTLPWASANAEWGAVHANANANGGPLVLDGKTYEHGLGTHAASEIAWRLPEGRFTRFQALCALDDGGAKQPNAHPDVEFQVWIDAPEDRSAFRALVAKLQDAAASESERANAARALAADKEGGLLLIQLANEGKLAETVRAAAAGAIYSNPDMAVRALAVSAFPRATASGKPLPPAKELASLAGDGARGETLFRGAKANCAQCHTFQGRGGDVGPDLTEIGRKYGREALLDAILNPSAAIAFGYDTWVVETKDGRLYSGFVLADADKLVIKDTKGTREVIDAGEVESREKQKLSAMPDNVALGLEPQELADLATFLQEGRATKHVLGTPVQLFDGKTLAGWTFHLNDANARMEDVWSVADGVLHCKGTPIGYLRTEKDYTNFELTLEWRFPAGSKPGNSGVLLRVQAPDTVWPKSIEAQLESRNAGDIWNIGEFPMNVEKSRTDGRHTAKALPCNEKPIGEWNRYRIRLDGGDLELEVNGEVQNRAKWCDVVPGKIALQSEGAAIEFRNVVLRPIE